jgi:hypothetical protein
MQNSYTFSLPLPVPKIAVLGLILYKGRRSFISKIHSYIFARLTASQDGMDVTTYCVGMFVTHLFLLLVVLVNSTIHHTRIE